MPSDFEVYKPERNEAGKPSVNKLDTAKRDAEKAKKAFTPLCKDYHKQFDAAGTGGWGIKSWKLAGSFHKRFLAFRPKVKHLPQALKNVFHHRMAYLKVMSKLGANPRIRAVVAWLQSRITTNTFRESDVDKYKNDPNFKKLKKALLPKDYAGGLLALTDGISELNKIVAPQSGSWGAKAKKILGYRRVDDEKASGKLKSTFVGMKKYVVRLSKTP